MLLLLASAPGQDSAPPQDQNPEETLKVNVNVVNVFFNVHDKHGGLVGGLTKDDFQLFEDGKPQTIKYFNAEANQPLTLGMLIDTSASQMRVLPMEQEVGAEFLKDVIGPKDLAFVLSLDVDVTLEQDYTNNIRDLRDSLERVKINTGGASYSTGIPGVGQGPLPSSGTPKGTLLYDAVYLAANDKLSQEVGRKAMILLTDGEDQGSKTKLNEAIEAAQKSDTICYVLLIADRGFYMGGYSGEGPMRKLAEETGGRVIDVGNRMDKLKDAFAQISNELRTQYSIGYTSTNPARDGSFRRIEIKSKNGDKIQARKGYYAPSR